MARMMYLVSSHIKPRGVGMIDMSELWELEELEWELKEKGNECYNNSRRACS